MMKYVSDEKSLFLHRIRVIYLMTLQVIILQRVKIHSLEMMKMTQFQSRFGPMFILQNKTLISSPFL